MIKKNSPVLSEFTFWDISDETHCILVNLVIILDILVQDNCKFIFWFEVLLFSFIFVFFYVINFLIMDCDHCRNCYL